jgi:hypothetical protein
LSERLLFNANSAIFQLYHGENKLIFNEMMMSYRIDGVIVSVLASSAVDRGFSAKQAALKRKSKDWLARNQNNVSKWSDMSTH